jgi:hypothetical protein
MQSTQQPGAAGKVVRVAKEEAVSRLARHARHALMLSLTGLALLSGTVAHAQETVCARVKIEIKQKLTLERQAFDAQMKITNSTTNGVIENVSIDVKMTEVDGTPVVITDDPNNLNAKFFIRVASKDSINDISGNGTVNPNTAAVIDWLIIPAPSSAGNNPLGKKYLVGATLKYRFNGEDQVLDVSPDVITVTPLPLLTLDYFLTQNVLGDDPLTPEIEPIVPYTLGVRVKNTGFATAKNLKIDSAQPKIVENNQGLLINFKLDGSYVNDAPVDNTLLINFGDIAPNTSKMGRWIMETSLAGKFTEFTAKFSHADDLGGTLTSIMQATNAHFLIRDVRVDLPGRDTVRDFLAQDGDVIRVYESDGMDTVVTDRSSVAQMTAGTNPQGNASYHLVIPPTDGFIYVKLPDPFNGQKALGQIVRSDAKIMLPENVWLSQTRNETTKKWEYWVNFFDVNTSGVYDAEFKAPPAAAQAPVIQFIPDHTVQETKQTSFIIEASSPNGAPVTITAAPLPSGATFVAQTVQNGYSSSLFDWTPAKGQAGNYLITYTATDGTLTSTRSANIKVDSITPPAGPAVPLLVAPLADAHVPSFKPTLIVQTGTESLDPTTQVQFEVYADSAMTQLIDSGVVNKGVTSGDPGTTSFTLSKTLNEDTRYWWRARGYDGTQIYSAWMNSKFFVNVANHPPESFNLTSPASQIQVASAVPTLSWTNSVDKDEDPITYSVYVYTDAALTNLVTSVTGLPPGDSGSTSWTVDKQLGDHTQYYWRVIAADIHGATTLTPARYFTVNLTNTAPTAPALQSPANGAQVTTPTTVLTIANATDADNDLLTYVFELDTVNTFDSGTKQSSGQVMQGTGATTSWTVNNLIENKRYYWRVKAQDGFAESDWVVGNFLMNAVNDAPPVPTIKNPGNGAWISSLQPTLEANPVLDPEGDAVQYQFQVYLDAALTQKVADGMSNSTAWQVPLALSDKTTHYWRVQALDPQNATAGWSAPSIMYISTGPYVDPTILVTAPAAVQSPTVTNNVKTVTIKWEGTDANIEPTVALYYSTSNSGYAGTLIADGLKQTAGTQTGSYVWDVSSLATGTYYVYAVIYDAKGMGRAYASGAVVIAPPTPAGSLVLNPATSLTAVEDGGQATFTVRLGSAPTADVVVPISSNNVRIGNVAPATLTFTAQNWQTPQTVTVTGSSNCVADGSHTFQVGVGKGSSLDPNYIDVQATPMNVTITDNDRTTATTNNVNLFMCSYQIISAVNTTGTTWQYTLKPLLTNTGADLSGLTATLTRRPSGTTVIDGVLSFGAVAKGETVTAGDTFVIQSSSKLTDSNLMLGVGFYWSITTP